MRVQTDQLTADQTRQVAAALAKAYNVPVDRGRVVLHRPDLGRGHDPAVDPGPRRLPAARLIAMALYFRTWKMSVAAIIALLARPDHHAGIYALVGFEITPAAMIGFLTILGYSLYDTSWCSTRSGRTPAKTARTPRARSRESVNLAVNQTLVRSINTAVVAVLPVARILFIGAYVLGARHAARHLARALHRHHRRHVLDDLRRRAAVLAASVENEPAIKQHAMSACSHRARALAVTPSPEDGVPFRVGVGCS